MNRTTGLLLLAVGLIAVAAQFGWKVVLIPLAALVGALLGLALIIFATFYALLSLPTVSAKRKPAADEHSIGTL